MGEECRHRRWHLPSSIQRGGAGRWAGVVKHERLSSPASSPLQPGPHLDAGGEAALIAHVHRVHAVPETQAGRQGGAMSGGIRLMAGGLFGARGCSARGAWLVGIVALLWWNQQLSQPLHCPVQHSLFLHDGLEVVVHLAAHLRLRNGVSSRVGRSKAARAGKTRPAWRPPKSGTAAV